MEESSTRALLQFRAKVCTSIRSFFETRGYLEVDTPVALLAPPPETHIDPISCFFETPRDREQRFLQTSPELPMKRLIATGSGPIFQLASVFRDNDESQVHRPEFRLLEWYNGPAQWTEMLDETEALLRHCARELRGEETLEFGGRQIDISAQFPRISVANACRDIVELPILECLERDTLVSEFKRRLWHYSEDDSWDELFHRIWVGMVEPELNQQHERYFITEYPVPLAALSRPTTRDPRVAERAECVVAGLELTNGFGELSDPDEQQARFEADLRARRQAGKTTAPLDHVFLKQVEHLEEIYGNALGIDRLMMLLRGVSDIGEISPFEHGTI